MLNSRIIPCLLVRNKGLVKTVKFKNPVYVGDPINAVRIFNEKEADELMVLDIDATAEGREPDYKMIEKLSLECRMPLCYGGGIKDAKQAKSIFLLGVEKIAISSIAVENPDIVKEIAEQVGNQSVVVVVDIKKNLFKGYDVYIKNGKTKVKLDLINFVNKMQEAGAGEIVINSIDNDGMMSGYDFNLVEKIKPHIHVPLTILGGAGSLDDIGRLIDKFRVSGAAAGSLFVFKGIYRAVLINYPSRPEKDGIFMQSSHKDQQTDTTSLSETK